MRTPKWLVLVVALIAIVAPGRGTGTAAAAPTAWVPAGCAFGSFAPIQHQFDAIIIPASVTICGQWSADYTFTMVEFRPGDDVALAATWNLRSYAAGGGSPVSAVYQPEPKSLPTVGVCLMSSPDTRLACIRLNTTLRNVTTATPIPVDDPLVSQKVVLTDDTRHKGKGADFCGTCLAFPI